MIEGEAESDSVTDATLLRAHVAGDPDAFTTLVTRHQDRLWTIAIRIMRNPEDAADPLQDAYIAAFGKAGSYRGDAQVTTWLHWVVVNACLDRLRTMRSCETEPLPENLDRWSKLGTTLIKDPVEIREQRGVVAAALGTLNPDQRATLVLVDMGGYSVEEAAQILGCAPGTVKSRCARGRARLLPLLMHLKARALEQASRGLSPHRFSQAWNCARQVTDGRITGLAASSLDGTPALLVYTGSGGSTQVTVVTGCGAGAPSAGPSALLPR